MRAIFNFACSSTLLNLSENPFDGMNVRQEKKRKKTLTKKQVKRILLILEQFHEEEKRSGVCTGVVVRFVRHGTG